MKGEKKSSLLNMTSQMVTSRIGIASLIGFLLAGVSACGHASRADSCRDQLDDRFIASLERVCDAYYGLYLRSPNSAYELLDYALDYAPDYWRGLEPAFSNHPMVLAATKNEISLLYRDGRVDSTCFSFASSRAVETVTINGLDYLLLHKYRVSSFDSTLRYAAWDVTGENVIDSVKYPMSRIHDSLRTIIIESNLSTGLGFDNSNVQIVAVFDPLSEMYQLTAPGPIGLKGQRFVNEFVMECLPLLRQANVVVLHYGFKVPTFRLNAGTPPDYVRPDR